MDFIQAANSSLYQIQSYTAGCITVNGQHHEKSILLSANSLALWRPQTVADLTIADLQNLAELKADVLLLGVGVNNGFLSPELQAYITKHRLPLEVMGTDAACRTFHVLTSEQRAVYAALML